MEKNKDSGKKRILMIVIPVIIILIAVIGVLVWMVLNPQKQEVEVPVVEDNRSGRGTVATPENIDEI